MTRDFNILLYNSLSNDIMLRFTFDNIRIQPKLGNKAVRFNLDQTNSPIFQQFKEIDTERFERADEHFFQTTFFAFQQEKVNLRDLFLKFCQ